MTYKEAKELKKANMHLIGTTSHRGYRITDILIVPAEQEKRDDFMLCYIQNRNANYCLLNYLDEDLIVMSVDTRYLNDDFVLFYDIIHPEPVLAN